MYTRIQRLEQIIKILIQHLQHCTKSLSDLQTPNNDNLVEILKLLQENEKLYNKDGTLQSPSEAQLLTSQLLLSLDN